MTVTDDLTVNLSKVLDFIRRAARKKSDFLLLPEYSLTSSHGKQSKEEIDDALGQFEDACRENRITALVGTTYPEGNNRWNQVRIITDRGQLLGKYNKTVCTITDRTSKGFLCGNELPVFHHSGLVFGILICNDLWVTPGCGPYPDPRLSYQLGQKGARLIFHAVGAPRGGPKYRMFHEGNLVLRAMESRLYIAVSNITGPAREACVTVGIVDPEGEWIARAPHGRDALLVSDISINGNYSGRFLTDY